MASQIRSFGMTSMTVASCSEFHNSVLARINDATPAALHVEDEVTDYKVAVETLSAVVNRQMAYVATQKLEDLDKKRDSAVGTIKQAVKAFLTSPVTNKREAALLLDPQLAAYTDINRHEYTKETAEIRGMLVVLDNPDNASAVETIGIKEEREALREANEAFVEAYHSKTLEKSEKMEQRDLNSRSLMSDANALYEKIVQIVNAYAIVQTSDQIETFITEVNGLVGTYADIAGSGTGSGSSSGSGGNDDKPAGGDDGDEDDNLPPVQ